MNAPYPVMNAPHRGAKSHTPYPIMRLLLFASLLIVAAPLAAQTTVPDNPLGDAVSQLPRAIGALEVEPSAIEVDGQLDEEAWARADVASGFVQRSPETGAPASEETEARVLYDGGYVYVGMRMYDSQPETISARLGRRDDNLESDWAFVGLGSYADGRTAFIFGVNPAGVRRDFLVYDDVREDGSWDAVWAAETSIDEEGWTAEFRIPLSQLRYSASEGVQEWGLQFSRELLRTGESSFWSPFLPEDNGMVSRFGTLRGLRGLQAPRSLEVQPYVASALTRAPGNGADPFYEANDLDPRVGVDVKYGLTSDVTLTATINPDFGQVEADPAQVNLGAFELFFDERRPFFVEGSDVFSFGRTRAFLNINRPNFLYTRRIGRSPQRSSFVTGEAHELAGDGGSIYTDSPEQTTILGAAKLSGRVGRFSVGVLNAVTAPEHGRFVALGPDGAELLDDRALVEPLSNYFVGRTRGRFGKTTVGAVVTDVRRDMSDPAMPGLLASGATVVGADFEHNLSDEWVVSGVLAGSRVAGSAEAIASHQRAVPRYFQRPDADHVDFDPTRTSLMGTSGELAITKAGGEHWLGSVSGAFTSPGFDANALGYQGRADHAYLGYVLIYNQNQPQGPFRRWGANTFGAAAWNFDGGHNLALLGGNANAQLRNFWGANAHVEVTTRGTNDRLTRGGPVATDPAGFGINGNVYSDSRKPVSVYAWTGMNRNEIGGRHNGVEAGVEVRPSPNVSLSLGPGYEISASPRQYVTAFDDLSADETFGRRYVFAEIEQESVSMSARLNWTFTPDLTLQLYARPFVATGRYSNYKDLGAPGALDFPVYGVDQGSVVENADGSVTITPEAGAPSFDIADQDFTFRSLQGNAVVRWEYRPGSTLFFVWQQQRSDYFNDGLLQGRDFTRLFSDPVQNVFLVKLSYWLG